MDPLEKEIARICGSMKRSIDRMSDMLTREADDMHAFSVGVGQAIEAQTAAQQLLQDAMQDEAA